jgi:hypothetical protein
MRRLQNDCVAPPGLGIILGIEDDDEGDDEDEGIGRMADATAAIVRILTLFLV